MARGPGWANATIFQTLGLVSITASGTNNSRGVRLFHNTGATGDLRISISDATTVLTTGAGSSNHAIFANYNNLNTGTYDIEIENSGSLSTAGNSSYGILGLYFGLGNVSASHSGTIVTVGGLSHGIQLRGQGPLNAGSVIRAQSRGNITTAGDEAVGVFVFADNNNSAALASIIVDGGVVTTGGVRAHGLYSIQRGVGHTNIEVRDGTVRTSGADAHGIFAQQTNTPSSGNISVAVAGNVEIHSALADGIRVEVNPNIPSNRNAVDFSVHVRGDAVVRGAGAGIRTLSGAGDRGDIRIEGNATIDGGIFDTDGDTDVVIAGGTVLGAISTGAGDDAIGLEGGAVTGDILAGDGNDLIVWSSTMATVGTGGLNNGLIDGGAGSDIVAINDASIDLSGMTLDGGDDVSAADGFVDVLALNFGWSGTLNGSRTRNFEIIYIDGGTVRFDDAAVIVSSGLGLDASLTALAGFPVTYGIIVDGSGTLDASNSLAVTGHVNLRQGTLLAGGSGSSAASISGQLWNPVDSLVDMSGASPAAGDRLRVGGNYEGGGAIRLDAALDASRNSDVVIIDGIVVSGVTALRIRDVGDGTGSSTGFGPGAGIRLIDVSSTGGTSAGQFVLENGPITVNAFTYVLNLESDGVWYLQSAVRPLVPALASAPHVIEDIALTFAGTLHERVGEQEHLKGRTDGNGVWVRIIGQRSDETAETGAIGALQSRTVLTGLQGGFDLVRWQAEDGSANHFGLSAGYVDAKSRSTSNGVGGATRFEGGIAGVHLTHYARGGWYADAGLYGSWIDVDAAAGDSTLGTKSHTMLASLEIGYGLPALTWGLQVEPQAQLLYLDRDLDDVTDGPRTWRFDSHDSLIGRLGVRLRATGVAAAHSERLVTGHLYANIWDVLSGGQDEMTIGTLPLELHRRGTWADIGLGFSVEASDGLTIYADGDVAFDVDGSDYHALTGKAGIRFNW